MGSPLGGPLHSLAGSGSPPAEEVETIKDVTTLKAMRGKKIKDDCGNLLSELVVWGTAPPTEEEEDKEEGKEDVHHDD